MGIYVDVLHMRLMNVRGWLVVELPDLPDLESRVGWHIGAIWAQQTQTVHSLVEVMATNADMIAMHAGL
jgi:hypothetical protein